jgi:hypothetical protein
MVRGQLCARGPGLSELLWIGSSEAEAEASYARLQKMTVSIFLSLELGTWAHPADTSQQNT